MEKLSSKGRGLAAPRPGDPIQADAAAGHLPTRTAQSRDALKEGRLASLFRAYGAWPARALRRRYGDQAEDFAQEAFLRAARYGDTGSVIRHPKALLLRIAHSAAADQARRHSEAVARDTVVVDFADYVLEPSQSAEQVELLLLKQLILQMPQTYRDVFVLSRFRAMSYAEISQAMGLPLKTVEWRISKAIAFCADALADSGGD